MPFCSFLSLPSLVPYIRVIILLKELFVNLTILITFNYLFTHLFKERLVHKKTAYPFKLLRDWPAVCSGLF